MSQRWFNGYLYLAAVIFFFAAAWVLFFLIVGGRVLELPDALLGLSHRKVFYLIGVLLLGTSAFLLVNRNTPLRLLLLTWLSGNLLVYHFGAAYNGSANLCAALGNLSPLVPFAPRTGYWVVSFLLVGLFLSSGGLLVANWLAQRKAVRRSSGSELPPGNLKPAAVK